MDAVKGTVNSMLSALNLGGEYLITSLLFHN